MVSRAPKYPVLWIAWCECLLGLGSRDAVAWWQGLSRASDSDATTLRSTILYHAGQRPHGQELFRVVTDVLTPQLLIESLEGCVREGLLSRQQVIPWQERIFARMRQGEWKGTRHADDRRAS